VLRVEGTRPSPCTSRTRCVHSPRTNRTRCIRAVLLRIWEFGTRSCGASSTASRAAPGPAVGAALRCAALRCALPDARGGGGRRCSARAPALLRCAAARTENEMWAAAAGHISATPVSPVHFRRTPCHPSTFGRSLPHPRPQPPCLPAPERCPRRAWRAPGVGSRDASAVPRARRRPLAGAVPGVALNPRTNRTRCVPSPRTNRTRCVPSPRTNRTRCVPSPRTNRTRCVLAALPRILRGVMTLGRQQRCRTQSVRCRAPPAF
jgi:hypothetical protein